MGKDLNDMAYKRILLIVILAIFVLVEKSAAQSAKPPNVLFIAIDDLRDYVEYFNAYVDVKTPNIDRITQQGVSFTNAYCQAPMCAASRNSLLTGIYPHHSGAYGFQKRKELESLKNIVTLPEHFRNNGYYVVGTGKIHHGGSGEGHGCSSREWDEYWPSVENPRDGAQGTPIKEEYKQPWGHFEFGPTKEGDEAQGDHRHGEWAAKRIEEGLQEPFFMAVGFFRPHLPWFVPQKYFDQYPPDKITPVARKENDLDGVPLAGDFFGRYFHVGRYAYDLQIESHNWRQQALQAYLASVSFSDKQVGKVLDALEKSGKADNTIIVLWTDHGFHLGEKKTWTKFTLWRESARVPMIFSVPGSTENKLCDQPVQLLDLYPTLSSLCGIDIPSHVEGNDISPLISHPEMKWDHIALTVAGRNNYAVSTEDWRFIRYFNGDEELYNIKKDPHELHNLAKNNQYSKIKGQLMSKLPAQSAPNGPGTTLDAYYDRDDWDIEEISKTSVRQYKERLAKEGK